jgi:hypothetical protein
MKKRPSKKTLMTHTEKFAVQLLYEATGGTIGKSGPQNIDGMQFSDKRALLDSLTRLLAIKHRIDPEEEKSDFMSMREELNGASRTVKSRTDGFASASEFESGEPDDDGNT